ncbi:MAG: PDZ domain-containing protein [Planctomycetota bacterium]
MRYLDARRLLVAGLALAGSASALAQQGFRPDAMMIREPDVSATHVVFGYANDLWLVPREGGVATKVASPDGPEDTPRFSPDGETIAFVGNYEGDRDVYTVPTDGGIAKRLTHHPGNETLNDWVGDDELLFYTAGLAGYRRLDQLFTVDADGGMWERINVPTGARASIHEDGEWLAYTPFTRDARTWKRYRGGWATDIWLFNLETYESRRMTEWEGTDTQPHWIGDTVYYLSDQGPEHRWNVWAYDTNTNRREQITRFDEFDVKSMSVGPGERGQGEIVLQSGPGLYLYSLADNRLREVDIIIPGERPRLRPERIDFSENITAGSISPSGKRVLITARGDIWSNPAKEGVTRHLVADATAHDRQAVWSPDGAHIAYISDRDGETDLWLMEAGKPETATRVTDLGPGYRTMRGWSPDSEHVAMIDDMGRIWLHNVESGNTRNIVTDEWQNAPQLSWSHDGAWLAFTLGTDNNHSSIWLYEVADGAMTQVTDDMFHDFSPQFDRDGDFLYFVSDRHFDTIPQFSGSRYDMIQVDTEVLLAVPLREDVASPMLAKSDEEEAKDEEEDADDEDADSEGDEDAEAEEEAEPDPIAIDLEGFESRAIQLPVEPGNFGDLYVNEGGALLYERFGTFGGETRVMLFDMHADDPEEETVVEDASVIQIAADGEHLLVFKSGDMAVIEAKADQKIEDTVPTDTMHAVIDPRDEWTQIFHESWRIFRDYFYDPGMHGVDWAGERSRYEPLLAEATQRDDLTFIIQEMISELNVGHAYYRPGTQEDQPSTPVGLLAADYELVETNAGPRYVISRFVQGAKWDTDARSPLAAPGLDVNEGDFLLAVNGTPVNTSKDPWAAFVGLANKTIELTVSDKPVIDDDARRVVVKTLGSEGLQRYRDWVESNRAYVDYHYGGRVGYAYIQNVSQPGINDMVRQLFGQSNKPAMIIDDRWNAGGYVIGPPTMIDLLDNKPMAYFAIRNGKGWPIPGMGHFGPKAMLANSLSASGGDMFPYLFKKAGLGPVIGTRTWGGLVGIGGSPAFVDGTAARIPAFAFYEKDGTWGVEGHGVDPDIEVLEDPALYVNGREPQLDAAIEYLLGAIEREGYTPVPAPDGPDRSGFGISEQDR